MSQELDDAGQLLDDLNAARNPRQSVESKVNDLLRIVGAHHRELRRVRLAAPPPSPSEENAPDCIDCGKPAGGHPRCFACLMKCSSLGDPSEPDDAEMDIACRELKKIGFGEENAGECPTCKGSGHFGTSGGASWEGPFNRCPTCKGSGRVPIVENAGVGASDDAVRCWITEARREAAPDEDSATPWDEIEADATVRAFFWSLARRAHAAGKKHQASSDAATIAGLRETLSAVRDEAAGCGPFRMEALKRIIERIDALLPEVP